MIFRSFFTYQLLLSLLKLGLSNGFLSLGPSSSTLLHELGVKFENEVPNSSVSAVLGSSVDLPCDIRTPIPEDSVRLVLWFKDGSSLPIYTYDSREKSLEDARHWSDDKVLTGRAFFRGDHDPGRLVLDAVKSEDEGTYKCRVDYKKSPTKITDVHLIVIVPSEKPEIYLENGNKVRLKLGPYRIGDELRLKCVALGGRPTPRVTWWRNHALLDDSFTQTKDFKVENELILKNIQRKDLHTILTCQASNNNISVPVSTSIKLDMHFGPQDVKILNVQDPLSAGKTYEIFCQSTGSRPSPSISWMLDSTPISTSSFVTKSSPDGNITISTLTFTPIFSDAYKRLICKANILGLSDSSLEDSWKLDIHYIPQVSLFLGTNLNASFIKEGDDVYFECSAQANPRPYKISWKHNGKELSHNIQKMIIISNQSLVLQKVTRSDGGFYTCTAHNSEGDVDSNTLTLEIRYKPVCKPEQISVYGVAKHEKVKVSCDVISNPSVDLHFDWIFNTSSERRDVSRNRFSIQGTRSLASHTPQTEMDYGSLLCWASNSIGKQESPCIYHLIPAGKPEPVINCSLSNITYSSLSISCLKGFHGGLKQTFLLEVQEATSLNFILNTTSSFPSFSVTDLRPGQRYFLFLRAFNAKGYSSKTFLEAHLHREPHTEVKASLQNGSSKIFLSPLLLILLSLGSSLCLLLCSLSLFFCIKCQRSRRDGIREKASLLSQTHIPLQRNIDDMITESHPLKGQDVVVDEDGGFANEGLKTQWSNQRQSHKIHGSPIKQTMRQSHCNNNNNNSSSSCSSTNSRNDYESLRCIKDNIASLSQEVTYAELCCNRNNGYIPFKRQNDSSFSSQALSPSSFLNTSSESSSTILEETFRSHPWENVSESHNKGGASISSSSRESTV